MQGFKPRDQRYSQSKKQSKQKKTNIGFANGGMIRGPGTGTSDDIEAKMPAGSYIMPADSTEQLGAEGLAGLGAPADVNVSSGEYQLPPEQVHAVGVQALDQMKEQTNTPTARGFQPEINRDGEQFFNKGGVTLGDEEAKRRAAQVQNQSPIALPPQSSSPAASTEQLNAERANRLGAQNEADTAMRAEQRKSGARAIENTKSNVSAAVDSIGDFVGGAYKNVLGAATIVPRTAYGIATGEIDPHQPARHPGADIVDANKAKIAEQAALSQQRNQQFSNTVGGAQSQMDAVSGLFPNQKTTIPSAPEQQPKTDPMTGQETESQPVVEQGVVDRPANEPVQTRHGVDTSNQQPKPYPETGYVERTDQERRDFARSNIVDGVPMLNSAMAKTINPASINTMGAQQLMNGVNPQTSQALSSALSAAAKRGDWDAVNRHYQSQGQSFGGMGAGGLGDGKRGAQYTVVRDPTRMPSNAELMNQRMTSAQQRNTDAGRKIDIEGQRVAAGIDNDQFRNQILDRQVGISGRGQDLAERQAEPTIAQQQRLQALYAEYDAADDEGKARIAQQINQLSGKSESLKDSVVIAGGGQEWNQEGGVMRNVPQRVIDLRTGQELGSGNQQPAQKAPAIGDVRGQYRFKGGNPADQKSWEKI